MVRLFEFRDLDEILEIWLEGNRRAHSFVSEEYWKKNFKAVKSILPNAEVYVYEAEERILGFIGMEGNYIAGLFVRGGFERRGIGRRLIGEVKKKDRLSLHVYEKNTGAVSFYEAQGFHTESRMREKETGKTEFRMVYQKVT